MYFYVFMHFCCELANVAKYAFFGRIFLTDIKSGGNVPGLKGA